MRGAPTRQQWAALYWLAQHEPSTTIAHGRGHRTTQSLDRHKWIRWFDGHGYSLTADGKAALEKGNSVYLADLYEPSTRVVMEIGPQILTREDSDAVRVIPPHTRECTCVGSCKGAEGLAPGWICVMSKKAPNRG